MTASWIVVHNPFAGSTRKRRRSRALIERIEERAPRLVEIETTPDGTEAAVTAALDGSVERVFVLGGDGTAGDVAGALLGTELPLSIVPHGTVNIVAGEIGLPQSPERALAMLLGAEDTIDFQVFRAAGRSVVLGISAGFDAEVMHRTRSGLKARIGTAAVGLAGLQTLLGYRFPRMEIEWKNGDGGWHSSPANFLIASNTRRYGLHITAFPDADPSDDRIDLAFGPGAAISTAGFWLRLMTGGGRQFRMKRVRHVRADRVRVTHTGGLPAPVQVNGDAMGHTPFEIEPAGTIRVTVPETRRSARSRSGDRS